VIELAILGLLKEGAMHGYELKKRLREVLGPLLAISFGSLYPALNRLERDGAVAAVTSGSTAAPPAMPMTGSFAGEAAAFRAARRIAVRGPRNKKVYGITELGSQRLAELIADPTDDERSFPVKVAFCRFVDPTTRVGLLERRRAALVTRVGEGRRTIGSRGDRLDRYVRSLLEHDTESTERDIAWIDRLLAEERLLASDPTAAPVPAATRSAPPVPATPAMPSATDGSDPATTATGGSR
jgi:DNA-binding PadR family transcriptional regulator